MPTRASTKRKRPSTRVLRESPAVYEALDATQVKQLGTFADSKQAPIHRWFQYPAGFSFRAVEHILDEFDVTPGQLVYDPFVGTGTTVVVCKSRQIEGFGVEAHPFVQKIATVKTKWDYDMQRLADEAEKLVFEIQYTPQHAQAIALDEVPELVRKCFSPNNLRNLLHIRQEIAKTDEPYRSFFYVALTCALRQASAAATGWPYISPKSRIQERDGIKVFQKQVALMISDLESTDPNARSIPAHICLGDARNTEFPGNQFDLSFTSPPYLNNYDYADRTRLETYFNGFASTWGDITEKVRKRLVMSATTQISRSKFQVADLISPELKALHPKLARELQGKVNELSQRRQQHPGKKSYDILVGQYFNDMAKVLLDTARVMKRKSHSIWIVGDSAPYGVFIPTDEYLAAIGLAAGFQSAKLRQLRTRGDKWRGNTQRHHVPLAERILIFTK